MKTQPYAIVMGYVYVKKRMTENIRKEAENILWLNQQGQTAFHVTQEPHAKTHESSDISKYYIYFVKTSY